MPETISPAAHPRPSRWAGLGIVFAVVVIQLLGQYVASRNLMRMVSTLVFYGVELPALMWALSLLYDRARNRGVSTVKMAAAGFVISATAGMGFAYLFWSFARAFPELDLHLSTAQPLSLTRAIVFGLTNGLWHFGLWTLAFALPGALYDARVRALEAEKLRLEAEQLKTAAELARLRGHLQPHFLLNTLNAIAGLVTEDARAARRLLVCLGDLLRDALHEGDELQTLDAQLEWLRRYAEILETRHSGALAFRWEIDPSSREALVPKLLLQPLVENAVKHGALRRPKGGEVVIRTAPGPDASTVVCTIEDNGPGMPDEVRAGAFGLSSVRRRLELRYLERARFTIESTSQGTRSVVELPRETRGA